MQPVLEAGLKYATNHVISHIPSYTVRHGWYRRMLGWHVGTHAAIRLGQHISGRHLRRDGPRVSIGTDTVIAHDCLLSTEGGLLIGDRVCLSPGVWLVTARQASPTSPSTSPLTSPSTSTATPTPMSTPMSMPMSMPMSTSAAAQPIVIDDDAWIGPRALILGGVTIGRGAIVQAGAVVTQDVAPHQVVGGVPATVVGLRHPLPYPLFPVPPADAKPQRPLFE